MNRWIPIAALAAAAGVAGLRLWSSRPEDARGEDHGGIAAACEERFELWAGLDGRLAARRVVTIASRLPGGATIVELVPVARALA